MPTNSRELTLEETHVGNRLPIISTADQIFEDKISKGELNFQPHVISLPELPILDSSPTPTMPSRFPVLCAKFGESKKNGFDLVILPPWAKHIHDDRFFLDSCF